MKIFLFAIAGLIILLAIAAIVVVILKKRQNDDDDDEDYEAIDHTPNRASVPAQDMPDPLSGVERLISTQRYDEALGELKRILMSNPRNTNALLKMLQIYGITNNHRAFNQLHQKIREIGDPETIEQADFCRSLLEDEQMLAPATAPAPTQRQAVSPSMPVSAPVAPVVAQQEPTLDPIDDLDSLMVDGFDLEEPTKTTASTNTTSLDDLDGGFDGLEDFGLEPSPAPASQKTAPAPVQEEDPFDFGDLDADFNTPSPAPKPSPTANLDTGLDADFGDLSFDTPTPTSSAQADDDGAFDLSSEFDLSFDSPAPAPNPKPAPAPAQADDGLDFGDFAFDTPAPAKQESSLPEFDLSTDTSNKADDIGFDFDLSPTTPAPAPTPSLDTDFGGDLDADFNFDNDFGGKADEPAVDFDSFSSANQLDDLSFDTGFNTKEDAKGSTVNDDFGFDLNTPSLDEVKFDEPKFDEPSFDLPSFDAPSFDTPTVEPSVDFGDFGSELDNDFNFDEPKSNDGLTSDFDFDTPAQADDDLSLGDFGFDTPAPAPTPSTDLDGGLGSDLGGGLDFGDLGSNLDNDFGADLDIDNQDSASLADFGFDDTPAPAPEPEPAPVAPVVAPVVAPIAPAKPSTESVSVSNRDFSNAPDNFAVTLELAQAYLGLGEHESARHLLEEVLAKGSPAEQQSANSLLARIA